MAEDSSEKLNVEASLADKANILESITDGFISVDADWRVTYINGRGEQVSRRTRKDVIGNHLFDVFPEARNSVFGNCYRNAMETREPAVIEGYYGPQEGWVEVNVCPDDDGGLTFFYRDITARKRMEILAESQHAAMESALAGNSLEQTLDVLVRAVEDQAGHKAKASILLMAEDGRHLLHGAAPNLPPGYCKAIDGIEIGENVGSCGTAAYTKQLVAAEDTATDPRWAAFKGLALQHGLRACWSMPILSRDKAVLGTFAVYYPEPRIPAPRDKDVVEILSRTAAIIIERERESRSRETIENALRTGERRLHQQQRLYETALSNTPDLVYVFDLQGRFSFANEALLNMWGRSWEDAIGKTCLKLGYEPWHAALHDSEIAEVIKTKRSIRGEVPFTGTNGKRIYDYIFVPVIGDDGQVEAIAGTTRDVTERKAAEEALREAAERKSLLAAIIASSDDAIISKDLNGNITSWNSAAERIFGYSEREAIGKHVTLITPPERLSEEEKILTTLTTGDKVDHFETMRRHKNGHLVPVSLTVSPIRDAAGHVVGASKVSRDISDRIKAEQALKETSQKKDDFLANMSHELRTPMNAVIGLANILKSMPDLPDRAEKYIETLKTSADHLMDLINDLLDFAKIESDSFQIESIEFDLAEQIEKVISIMNVKAREKELDLFVNYNASLNRYFLGDPLRIHQVLINLLSNAIKFTEKGSVEIDIQGTSEGPATTLMTIKVSDTGIGIPADKLATIFDKFTQADTSITRRFGGSGLGLAISKACVERMGGTISVDSQLGLGTTFTVRLPFKNTDKISNVESFSIRSSPEQLREKRNILLVEDYEPNVLVAGSMIEQLGYNFEVAKNGLDALRKFVHGHYDVVLMDVQMNELDGLEATRRIRKIETEKGLERTPIVAMTAHVREQDKDKCLDAGMDDFIPKPFDPWTLSQKITRYIKLNAHMDELTVALRPKDRSSSNKE